MASQWTMSSQDDCLSGQNFGLPVIFTAHIMKRTEKNTFSVLKFLWPASTTGNSPKFILSPEFTRSDCLHTIRQYGSNACKNCLANHEILND